MAILVAQVKSKKANITADNSRFTHVWMVVSDSQITEAEALFATDPNSGNTVPSIGDPHPDYSNALVVSSDAENIDDGESFVWEVTATYEGYGITTQDPNTVRATVLFGSAQYSQVIEKDSNGDPIENSAGDPFDPPIQQEDSRLRISVTQKMTSEVFSPSLIKFFENSVNLDAIRIGGVDIEPKFARILDIELVPGSYQNTLGELKEFFTARFEIEVIPQQVSATGYVRQLLDAGFNELYEEGEEIKQRAIMVQTDDGESVPATEPQKLDGEGKRYIPSTGQDKGIYLEKETYLPLEWKNLTFPQEANGVRSSVS